MQVCMDNQLSKINAIENQYPLLHTYELIDNHSGDKFFSKIDFKFVYYQIHINLEDTWYGTMEIGWPTMRG
jgi:hypothetical protein